ncbi:MAG: glycosyltransferase [Candidatus Binataceae bacterium]
MSSSLAAPPVRANPPKRSCVAHVGKFYPPHRGGIETHLEAMCKALTAWYDLKVIVANDGRHTINQVLDGVRVERLGSWFNFAGAPVCPAMVKAIRDAHAELVHLQWPNPMAFVAYLASRHQGPLVVSWQSDVIRQKTLDRLFAPVTRAVLRRASRILVSSPNYAVSSPFLAEHRRSCRVVPLAISTESFLQFDPAAVERIRKKYGTRLVLSVGRLVYYKGIEYLIRAMTRVQGTLLIIGEGPLRQNLERQAGASAVADRVIFLGDISDLVPFYHACDVFVLPSIARSEAFGMVQLEAMASAKPIVNTRLDSGVPFVSPDGITGITVAPGDEEALAKAVTMLLDDPQLREKYGQAGLRRVREEFAVDKMAILVRAIYDELLHTQATSGVSARS